MLNVGALLVNSGGQLHSDVVDKLLWIHNLKVNFPSSTKLRLSCTCPFSPFNVLFGAELLSAFEGHSFN